MALDPILWAMKDAPVADLEEWAVLVIMAESADEDGCNAFQATKTIATRARLSTRTVQRRIDGLVERGLLRQGDQTYWKLVKIPAGRRPINYDVMIPYSWFGNVARVNDYREGEGRAPLRPSDRPDLPDAPEAKRRRDAGVPKAPKAKTQAATGGEVLPFAPPDTQGRLQVTPESRGDYKSPLTTSHPTGDSESTEGRQEVTQPSPNTHPPTLPTTSAAPSADSAAGSPDGSPETGPNPDDGPKKKRGTRIPEDFADNITQAMVDWFRANCPDVDPRVETANFVDYWVAKPGKDGVKLDWVRTWQTWMRNEQKRATERKTRQATRQGARYDSREVWGAIPGPGEQNVLNGMEDVAEPGHDWWGDDQAAGGGSR